MRFTKITHEEIGQEPDYEFETPTQWWLDSARPIKGEPGFVAVQTYADKDANDFVKCENMRILYNDQAEYYFVCGSCYSFHRDQQFTGSTRGSIGWRDRANFQLKKHEETKGWCEFCDPIFGNGGWS